MSGVSIKDGAPGRGSGRYALGSGKRPQSIRNTQKTIFVSGSSKTQAKESAYYREQLPDSIKERLDDFMKMDYRFVVGDAPGIDRQVQDYLKSGNYKYVNVYGPGTAIRYVANPDWKTRLVNAPEYEPGSKEWLAKKDIAMTNVADEGLAIILDNGANATRRNVERLVSQNKDVLVYELSEKGSKYDKWVK